MWKLDGGDYDSFQWEVLDVETNPALPGADTLPLAPVDVGPRAALAR